MRYVARVHVRDSLHVVKYRGDLAYVRAKASRKLRQVIAKGARHLQVEIAEGRVDPLAAVLYADHVSVRSDPWGGTISYKNKTLYDGVAFGSFVIYLDLGATHG